jgi:uncharacterized protein (TIGR03435 family)
MLKRLLAMSVLLAGTAWAQSSPSTQSSPSKTLPKFQAADVHTAPYRAFPFANGGVLRGDRYVWHQATIVDLVAAAYGVNSEMVQAGPPWIERDRFEVVGLADPKTSKEDLKLMLQSLLAERFALVLHEGEKPMPAYVLTIGKDGKPKLEDSSGGTEECTPVEPPQGQKDAPIDVKCSNQTMPDFATTLHDFAGGYLDKPVVDKTGLKGTYDIEIKWHGRGVYDRLGPADGISIFDAVDKQLGLKLTLETSPQHVWIVDGVNRQPTPNPPDVAKLLPPLPPAVFEVATVKPSAPDARGFGRINGNQVNAQGLPLKFLVTFAWDLNPNSNDDIVGAPSWMNDDKFDILAKVSSDKPANSGPQADSIDFEDLRAMVKQLLIERFQMKVHTEDRPIPAYTLYAVKPKMKIADPTERTKCSEGPGPDGKDPRKSAPILNRLVTCQNMTSAEIADELQHIAGGYIYGPVLDKSGLDGAYDFTLSFSSADRTNGLPPPSTANPESDAGDPSGALTLYDAVSRQLGLKLVKEKRPMPVLVIDSIQEKPIDP